MNLNPLSFGQIRNAYLTAYNGTLTLQQNAGLALIQEWKSGSKTAQQIIAFAQEEPAKTSEAKALQSLVLRHEEANRLLGATLDGSLGFGNYETRLSNRLGAGDVGQSTERIALLSAFYNTPALIGPGMRYALQSQLPETARAAAWFELRINHKPELQGRRDRESNLLHLVSTETGKERIEEIKYALDFLFNGKTQGGNGVDVYQTIQAKNLNENFERGIAGALDELKADLGVTGDIHFVQRGADGQSNTIRAKAAAGKSVAETNNMIFAGDKNDIIYGGEGSDVLVGGKGNNVIFSGANSNVSGNLGDDIIIGGEGVNFLHGSAGNNTIIGGSSHNYIHGGGAGNNVLTGGGNGSTIFDVGFNPASQAFAQTTITNFKPGVDYIYSNNSTIRNIGIQDDPAGAVIRHKNQYVILQGVKASDIVRNRDLYFGPQFPPKWPGLAVLNEKDAGEKNNWQSKVKESIATEIAR